MRISMTLFVVSQETLVYCVHWRSWAGLMFGEMVLATCDVSGAQLKQSARSCKWVLVQRHLTSASGLIEH